MKYNKVIIIGSGIGGLCAASAISPYCNSVVVYDKDLHADQPSIRKGVPQGAHISILLQAGLINLETLLPGIKSSLTHQGSAEIQAGTGQQIHEFGQWTPRRALDLVFLGQSRPFLEHAILQRVRDIDNVSLVDNCRVKSLTFGDHAEVSGITLQNAHGAEENIDADLVIDASGVGGKFAKQFSAQLGEEIIHDEMNIGIFYSTAHFHKPSDLRGKKENILIVPEAGESDIGGSLIDIEENRWCVSLHGRNHVTPPKNIQQWKELAKALPDTRIWERISQGTLIGDIQSFKKPKATWRRFDKLHKTPKGYLPVGDTISSVNPIFGQGMTVTTGHVLALQSALACSDNNLWRNYIDGAASWSEKAWQKACAYDKNFMRTLSLDPKKAAILKSLALARQRKSHDDPEAHLNVVLQSQMLT